MFIVNIAQLTKLLDVSQYSLYASLKYLKKQKDTLNYRIDIDSFLINHKVNNFKFIYESTNYSFSDRLKDNLESLSEKEGNLTARQVCKVLNINNYKLYLLRQNKKIQANKVNLTRYKYTATHLKDYIKAENLITQSYIYKYSKQFYSPKEVVEILKERFNLSVSLKTVYRYIYDYNKIPCVKIGGNLKIPILEFENNLSKNADSLFNNEKR